MNGDRDIVDAFHPQEGSRHIEMDAGRVDTGIGTVRIIAIEGIFQPDIAAGVGDFVYIPIYPIDCERLADLIRRRYVIDILAKFMGRIAARRGPAHPEYGCTGRDIAYDQLDLRFVMRQVGKGNDIADSLGKRWFQSGHNRRMIRQPRE